MTQEARKSKTAVSQSEREELLEAMLLGVPELTLTLHGDVFLIVPDADDERAARIVADRQVIRMGGLRQAPIRRA